MSHPIPPGAQEAVDAIEQRLLEIRLAELERVAALVNRLSTRDLRRLNDTLAKLDEQELKRVAAFAEGLAEWSSLEQSSVDAKVSNGSRDPASRARVAARITTAG